MSMYRILSHNDKKFKNFIEQLIDDLISIKYNDRAYTYHISYTKNNGLVYINVIIYGNNYVISCSNGRTVYHDAIENYIENLKRQYIIDDILI